MAKTTTHDIAYNELDRQWKAACSMLLGGEVGELSLYEPWLSSLKEKQGRGSSVVSGKPVEYAVPDYCPGAKGIGFEEIDFGKKFSLSMNEIKDIDSLLEAIQDRACYAGNIVLGNSKFISGSSSVIDSFYVLGSNMVSESKCVAYSSIIKNSEFIFGTTLEDYSKFLVRGSDTYNNNRALEIWSTYLCSDAYYLLRCENCHDCMFCFNLRGKRNAIGNLELEKGKYLGIKKKLVSEMRQMLEKDKKLPSLIEIVAKADGKCTPEERKAIAARGKRPEEKSSKKPIENAFAKASEVIFGKKLGPIDDYGPWLLQHVKACKEASSAISDKKTLLGEFTPFTLFPKDRLLTMEEGDVAGHILKISEKEAEECSIENIHKSIGKIAYFASEIRLGENFNLLRTFLGYKAHNCYWGGIFSNTKYSAFSHFARNSDYMFGSTLSYGCTLCINCYNSNNISRSFEMDSCFSCSDCYFCHNCENLQNCMFCFNVKNKKYAIGNVEVGKQEFTRIKGLLLGKLLARLEAEKRFATDIYNIGCRKNSQSL